VAVDKDVLRRMLDLDLYSLQQIGQELGVSRQRIKQLADRMGYRRTDQRLKPDKAVPDERVPPPWAAHEGGQMQWKRDTGICQHSGCLTTISTKTLCREHADLMSFNARARRASMEVTSGS
jgi:hypothetical protein